jgi:hypothetical protein
VHEHGIEQLPPPSSEGSVLVDVGGSFGALVVFAPEPMHGVEIELRLVDGVWSGTHTAVRRRELRDGLAYAGVFGSLPEGEYELRIMGSSRESSGDTADLRVAVYGGAVTNGQWPTHPEGSAGLH